MHIIPVTNDTKLYHIVAYMSARSSHTSYDLQRSIHYNIIGTPLYTGRIPTIKVVAVTVRYIIMMMFNSKSNLSNFV